MVVIDSSGWIEFFTDGPKAKAFARHLKKPDQIVTPSVVLYEVYKKIKRARGESLARLCAAQIEKTPVAPLTADLALRAADLSLEYSLPMADAIVLATARLHEATLVTTDTDFQGIPGVRLL